MTPTDFPTRWRRFERTSDDGTVEYYEARHEGIRCFLRWGSTARKGSATTVVLDDETAARRHLDRKVAERLRKGFTEVAPPTPLPEPADSLVVPTLIAAETKPWYTPDPYEPVAGRQDVVCQRRGGFYRYLVQRDSGRSAISVNVTQGSHRPADVEAFLVFVAGHGGLPFDGRSHHKTALPTPIGGFTHALFCSPALGRSTLSDRVGLAFPLFDCEIGDADPEVLVDARLTGRTALNWANWSRAAHPAVDVRGSVTGRRASRVFGASDAASVSDLVAALRDSTPDSWLEIRCFRGDVVRLVPADVRPSTAAEVAAFLLGEPRFS